MSNKDNEKINPSDGDILLSRKFPGRLTHFPGPDRFNNKGGVPAASSKFRTTYSAAQNLVMLINQTAMTPRHLGFSGFPESWNFGFNDGVRGTFEVITFNRL